MEAQTIVTIIADYKAELFHKEKPTDEERTKYRASVSKAARLAQEGVAPLPESVTKLLELLRNPEFAMNDAVAIVEGDPALAAEVVHLANSAANAGRSPCDDVACSFRRLGAKAVADLAVAAHVMEIGNSASGFGREVAEHCVRVAALLRSFPAFRGYSSSRLFLCGLVHDLGILLLDQTGEFRYNPEAMEMEDDDLRKLEEHKLGFDHATLCAVAVKMWEVPDPVSRVVLWHHDFDLAKERGGDVAYMVASIRLAEHIERAVGDTNTMNMNIAKMLAGRREAQFLGLTADDIELLWESGMKDELDAVSGLVA